MGRRRVSEQAFTQQQVQHHRQLPGVALGRTVQAGFRQLRIQRRRKVLLHAHLVRAAERLTPGLLQGIEDRPVQQPARRLLCVHGGVVVARAQSDAVSRTTRAAHRVVG